MSGVIVETYNLQSLEYRPIHPNQVKLPFEKTKIKMNKNPFRFINSVINVNYVYNGSEALNRYILFTKALGAYFFKHDFGTLIAGSNS